MLATVPLVCSITVCTGVTVGIFGSLLLLVAVVRVAALPKGAGRLAER